jgi:LmbE family N-acetylglucosaminyl deacetylase
MAPLNILVIGAHPDDCEIRCGGTAARYAASGHRVKFVAVTEGSAGHHIHHGPENARRRRGEAAEAARRLGISEAEVLPLADGFLEPTIANRLEIIRLIRSWKADVVITHRPNDYHADHRATSVLVQDAAYLVLVPRVCEQVEVLRTNPVFLYMEDTFQKPWPFTPSITVDVASVWEKKIAGLDAHASQFYEWLPWVGGGGSATRAQRSGVDGSRAGGVPTADPSSVPADPADRPAWLDARFRQSPVQDSVRAAFLARYPDHPVGTPILAEAFELCEYGRQPTAAELDELFPK